MREILFITLLSFLLVFGCGSGGGGGGGGGGKVDNLPTKPIIDSGPSSPTQSPEAPFRFQGKVDDPPPKTIIDSGPSRPTHSLDASFRFHCRGGPCTYQCRLKPGKWNKWKECTSPKKYKGLKEGKHIFKVRAINVWGITDPTPAKYAWIIDTTAPDTIITSRPSHPSNSQNPTFEFTCNEGNCIFFCNLDFGAGFACSSPQTYPGLSAGSHTFRVLAVDLTGNVDPIPESYTWIIDLIPPETTITSRPPDPSNSPEAALEFFCNEANCTFQCQLDDGGYVPCSSPADYPGLLDGPHTFEVYAIDQAGNPEADPARHSWTVDTLSPDTIITGFPPDPANVNSGDFTFICDEAVCSFECQLDGGGFSACDSPKNYPGLSDARHTFQVRAIDAANNIDATPASYSWRIDTIPPDTSLTSNPPNPSNLNSAIFTFTCNEAVCSFECQLDGGEFNSCASPKDYAGLSEGNHTFQARATDAADLTDPTPATYAWLIDTIAPVTLINSNPPDPSSSSSASFSFTCTEAGCTFKCQLDGGGFSACNSPKDYAGLSDGTHTFEVQATDASDLTDPTPAAYTWVIDTTPPDTSITFQPPDPSNSRNPIFEFTCDEGNCTFECKLDSGAWAGCSSPQTCPGLSEASYTFEVRAIDAVGHVDSTPATYTWVIDLTAPDTSIISNPPNPSTSSSASFSFTCTEAGCSFECQLDLGGWSACDSPKDYAGLSDAGHTFQVRAIDPANNVDPSPAGYAWKIDTTPPDTIITFNPPNPTKMNSATFTFTCDEAGCAFKCQLDLGGFSPCASPKDYFGRADGNHTFQVQATDAVGLSDPTPATYTWLIDTTAPDTSITSKPPNPSNTQNPTFEFACNEASCTFECQLDAGTWSGCSSPQPYLGLSEASHTFQVRAIDVVGLVDSTPAAYTWTIDITAPDTTITSKPLDPSNSSSARFSFICTEPGCSFECQLDLGGWSPCASPKDYKHLSVASHNFQVRATDPANNVDPSPATYTWTIDATRYNCFQIIVDQDYQVTVIPPLAFSSTVDYPGLKPERVSDQISIQSWISSQNPTELVIEVTNIGSNNLSRLWLVGELQIGGEVLNQDALNKGDHPILVFGPISPGQKYSRTITLNITEFPCNLLWDPLKIIDRVVYSSDYRLPLYWRLWSSNLSGGNQVQITNFQNPSIRNGRPAWTPGMDWIGFDYSPLPKKGIAIIHPDGSHFQIIAEENSSQINFFPDGKSILYLCSYRIPTSTDDICLNDLSGTRETVLIRGDGYYWDGSQYQTYTPLQGDSAWHYTTLYQPRLSPDGQKIVFMAQVPNLASGPGGNLINRWVLLDAKFDPATMSLQGPPEVSGKLFDGNTLGNANNYLGLYEFVPSFSPDGKNLIGFLKIQKRNTATKKFQLDFYGLVRIKIEDLMSQPSTVYLGNANYLDRIYNITNFSNSVKAFYINFQDYSPEVGGILFTVKFDDLYASLYLLQVDSSFQRPTPLKDPKVFVQNAYFNAYPDVSTPLLPGFYR